MKPGDFMRAVWPSRGPYCVAYLFHPKGEKRSAWKHLAVDSVEEVGAFVMRERSRDLFYAMFSLREREVWDETKVDYKTGTLGAMTIRKQSNMLATRCFFFDIDVGPSKPYPDQAAAIRALVGFTTVTNLPIPTVISSGGGIHVYWLFDNPLAVDHWLPSAIALRQLANVHGLKVDPARTTDVASVLRIPGSYNHKDPLNPRLVQIIKESPATPVKDLQQAISDALVRTGETPQTVPKFPGSASSIFGESNLKVEYEGPAVHVTDAAKACAQLRTLLKTEGNVDEPAWYHGILGTTLYLVSDTLTGDQLAHRFSSKHPDYTPAATDAKIAQRRQRATGPTSCRQLAEVSPLGIAGCTGCPFANDPSVPNPLVAARKSTKAAPPVVQQLVAGVPKTTEIPDPPAPYARLKDGGVAYSAKDKEGNESVQVIYPHDLYPVRRLTNAELETEQQVWCVVLPREGAKEFTISAPALYDSRKFTEVISHNGIYPAKAHVPYLQDYMVAYISKLQELVDAETQANHLGWAKDYREFILPDKVLLEDGTTRAATLGLGAQRSSEQVKQAGTLQRQVELLRFYDHPRYLSNQVLILASLAAPLFYMTGHHGVIINASGVAGASKSSSLYTAASMWGDPAQYPLNGTNAGATTKGRNERVTVMANLPICVDEITNIPVKEAVDLAMGITQPGHRIRLHNDGTERKAHGGHKATIMLTTANSSLHALLSTDNTAGTAGSMRVFELEFRQTGVHTKAEADEFMRELKLNFGHIGPEFIAHVIRNRAAVEARVHAVMREVDEAARIAGAERFWSAACATILVACEVAKSLGLLSFDRDVLFRHLLMFEIPRQRGIVNDEYSSPLSILTDYLESIHSNIIMVSVTPNANGGMSPFAARGPSGAMLAHYDLYNRQIFVLKKAFKDYCARIGANSHKILEELSQSRPHSGGATGKVILNKEARRTLGAGTEYAKAQSWVFVVDMSHPDVADVNANIKAPVLPIRAVND